MSLILFFVILIRLSLIFTLNKSYPKSIPLIEVSDVKGLSKKQIDELKELLSETANSCVGEVMIHDIAVAAENYLEDHNKKPLTLHEQMTNRQQSQINALKDIKDGSLFTDSKETKEIEDIDVMMEVNDASIDLRRQGHVGERAGSVGSDILDESEDWLQSLLKRQHGMNMGGIEGDDPSNDSSDSMEKTTYQLVDGNNSRYQKEFQEIALLGKGAGGEVWKVKNSLDRRAYAIKKILLNPTNEAFNRKIRREVTTISRLLHKNIVRYYAAWMEDVIPVKASAKEPATHDYSSSLSLDSGLLQGYLPKNGFSFNVDSFQDLNLEFEAKGLEAIESSNEESESDESSSDSTSSSGEVENLCAETTSSVEWGHIEFLDSASEDSHQESIEVANETIGSINEAKACLPTRFLYIQMEFCDATLRAAIDGGKYPIPLL